MVGVPKTNRCQGCKARKIKCDEAWPTCGNCRATGKTCSGPTNNHKFVVNGNHREITDDHQSSITLEQDSSSTQLVRVKHRAAGNGSAYSRLKMLPRSGTNPVPPPTTPADRLSSRLVSSIESSADTPYDIIVAMINVPQLPQLLATQNVALCSAVHLYLSAWGKLRQGHTQRDALDLNMYNKAIRSLRHMLGNPEQRSESSTLVAAVVLTKFELSFEASKPVEQLSHVQGVYWLLKHGGPPKSDDDIRINLAFQTLGFSLRWFVDQEMDPFYTEPEWFSALQNFVNMAKFCPPMVRDVYRLWLDFIHVPGIIRDTRKVARISDLEGRIAAASEILQSLRRIDQSLDGEAHSVFQGLFTQDKVCQVMDPQSPLGWSYLFKEDSFFTSGFVNLYGMLRIMVLRIRQYIHELINDHDATLEAQCLEWSRVIWKCIPYGITRKPLLASGYFGSLLFSFESGGPLERAYLLDGIAEMNTTRDDPSPRWQEEMIIKVSRMLVGRETF